METTEIELSLPPITVIIAAYNEQAWIEITITSFLESGIPCEIVVVDDGSNDKTSEILKKFESAITIVTHPINKGKGAAIVSGLNASSGEIVVFCDAHVLGLTKHHLLSLVLPLVYGSAKAVLGIDIPEEVSFSLARTVSPLIILTGQRAYFREDLIPLIPEMENLGYGVETYWFSKFPRDRTAVVLLPGVIHLNKKDTSSVFAATVAYLREVLEILGTIAKVNNLMPKGFEPLVQSRHRLSLLLSKS